MKKITLFFCMLLFSTTCIFAQEYNQSFGIVAGSANGLSYKKFIKENVVVQTDLSVNLIATRGTITAYGYSVQTEAHLWALQLNPNFYHQKTF